MWKIRKFKSRAAMRAFVDKNGHDIQWHEIFVNNAYAIQYRRLMRVY